MRQSRFLHTGTDDPLAQVFLVEVVRRGVGDQHNLRAGGLGIGRGRGVPGVFADDDAEARAVHFEHKGLGAGLKVALLVKDLVVGQFKLVVPADHTAVKGHCGAIGGLGQHAGRWGFQRELWVPDQHVQARECRQLGDERIERACAGVDERRAQQQVFGRIARERQFRREQDARTSLVRFARGGDNAGSIAGEIADGAVDLGESDRDGHGGNVDCKRGIRSSN